MPPKIYASKIEDVVKPINSTGEKKPRTEKQLATAEKAKRARIAKAAENFAKLDAVFNSIFDL